MIIRKKLTCLVLSIICSAIYIGILGKFVGNFEPIFSFIFFVLFMALFNISIFYENKKIRLYTGLYVLTAFIVFTILISYRVNQAISSITSTILAISLPLLLLFGGLMMYEEKKMNNT